MHSMEARIKDSGWMICRRDMGSRSGARIRVSSKVSSSKGSNKVSANRYGQMALCIKVIGRLI